MKETHLNQSSFLSSLRGCCLMYMYLLWSTQQRYTPLRSSTGSFGPKLPRNEDKDGVLIRRGTGIPGEITKVYPEAIIEFSHLGFP